MKCFISKKGIMHCLEEAKFQTMPLLIIEKYLKRLCYPIKREKILKKALDREAPQSILDILCRLEDKEYRNIEAVVKEVFREIE